MENIYRSYDPTQRRWEHWIYVNRERRVVSLSWVMAEQARNPEAKVVIVSGWD